METIYLLLGSNQGNRLEILREAVNRIGLLGSIVKISSVYCTRAWGNLPQPDFLNQAVEIKSNLNPTELLEQLKEIELLHGKKVIEKWGPRTLDIDILFYGNLILNTPDLVIPHPRLQERKFVLIPLKEIAPDVIHPILNKSILELEDLCIDDLEVWKLD